MDAKVQKLVDLVASENGVMDAEDPRLDQYCGDRGNLTDTINLAFDLGVLAQVGSEDNFTIRSAVNGNWWNPSAETQRQFGGVATGLFEAPK